MRFRNKARETEYSKMASPHPAFCAPMDMTHFIMGSFDARKGAHKDELTAEKPSRNKGETGVTNRKYSSNEDEINARVSRIQPRKAQAWDRPAASQAYTREMSSWFTETPCSAASITTRRCCSGVIRRAYFPE